MTEEEYIKVLKRKYSRSARKIQEELSECRRIADEKGCSLEEVYDARAEFYSTILKTVTSMITTGTDDKSP